ncbi:hypothetical protein JW905_00160, partial [bacterium]|nr:hypothetical protein [candidate division CSSED10-310 bacterium]
MTGRQSMLVGLVVIGSLVVILQIVMITQGETAFPLDDAYIHLRIARNLASGHDLWSGRWPGMRFNGSSPVAPTTAPLWTLLMTVPFLFGCSPFWFAWCIGIMLHAAVVAVVFRLSSEYFDLNTPAAAFTALLTGLDWQLAWSAVSGMETTMFILAALVGLLLSRKSRTPAGAFACAALPAFIRPEGGLLLVATAVDRIAESHGWRKITCILEAGLAGLAPLLFTGFVRGNLVPSTFTAKTTGFSGSHMRFL